MEQGFVDNSSAPPPPQTNSLLDLLRGLPRTTTTTNNDASHDVRSTPDMGPAAMLLNALQQPPTSSASRDAASQHSSAAASIAPSTPSRNESTVAIDEETTAQLKSVLFGGGLGIGIQSMPFNHQPSPQEPSPLRQPNASSSGATLQAPRGEIITTVLPVEQLERSLSEDASLHPQSSPIETSTAVVEQENEPSSSAVATPSKTASATAVPVFTYVNPFDLLTKSKRPSSASISSPAPPGGLSTPPAHSTPATASPSTVATPVVTSVEQTPVAPITATVIAAPKVTAAPTTTHTTVPAASVAPAATTTASMATTVAAVTDASVARSEPSVQSGYGASPAMFLHPVNRALLADEAPVQRHHSPLMVGSAHSSPDYTARTIRTSMGGMGNKGLLSSVPGGNRLLCRPTTIDVSSGNMSMIAAHDLDVTTITLMQTDARFHTGSTISATKRLIAYATKSGNFRVIHQHFGTRALINGHAGTVLDMVFFNSLRGESDAQRLVTVGSDHRLCVWQFSEPHPMERDGEIPWRKILEIDGAPADVTQPRFRRVVWHPTNSSVLACAADRGQLLIFDLAVLLDDKEEAHLMEGERNLGAIQLRGHEKSIIDLNFSADGSEVITAGGDGTVRVWRITEAAGECINVFSPFDGRPVTMVQFIETVIGSFHLGTERGILVASNYNRDLKLLRPDGQLCYQQLTFVNEIGPREFFNVIKYNPATRTLVIANSRRESLYCIHVPLEHVPRLDYILEFPLEYPAVSLAVAPDCHTDIDSFALCCIQTGAVQQFHVPRRDVLPLRWERAQVLETTDSPVQHAVDDAKAPFSEHAFFSAQQPSNGLMSGRPLERTSSITTNTTNDARSPVSQTFVDAGDFYAQHHMQQTARGTDFGKSSPMSEAANKLKPPRSSGRTMPDIVTGAPAHAGVIKAAGKIAESGSMIRDHPAFRSPLLKPRPESSETDPGPIGHSQIRLMEDSIVSRIGKLFNKELSKREERWERDRQVQLAAEISHIEALFGELAHSLHDTLAHMVVDTIQAEMSERILPSLERSITNIMEKSTSATLSVALDDHLQKAILTGPLGDSIQQAVTTSLRPVVESSVQSGLRDLLPALQQSLEASKSAALVESRRASVRPHYSMTNTTDVGHIEQAMSSTQSITADLRQALHVQPSPPINSFSPNPTYPVQQLSMPPTAPPTHHLPIGYAASPSDSFGARVEAATARGQYDAAIIMALESQQPPLLLQLMTQLTPTAAFPLHQPSTLAQPVVLALLHQIGLDLQQQQQSPQQRDTRFAWLQSALGHLNIKDPVISDHCLRLLPELEDRVKQVYYAMYAETSPSNPSLVAPAAVLRRIGQLVQLSRQP